MNPFYVAIHEAKERGENDLAKRLDKERRMISALVRAAISRGYSVTIDNGESVEISKSRNYQMIMHAAFATDEEHLILFDAAGKKVAWFHLVYGNDGFDVVSDYGVNEISEELWKNIISPLADRLEREN